MIHSLIREDCTMKRIFIFAAMAAISLTACQQEITAEILDLAGGMQD